MTKESTIQRTPCVWCVMNPYYQDEAVTLYNARCEDVLPRLELSGPVHLLTDPPYFGVKPDEWDNQWGKADEFLAWMGEWLDLAKPHLGGDASVWVFVSPEMTSAVERVVAERFRVLNTVRWLKPQGWHMKTELAAARSFLSGWEGIVFAERVEQFADAYGDAAAEHCLARRVRAPRAISGQT
jgi:adenine-specific DNA-methyltransferase